MKKLFLISTFLSLFFLLYQPSEINAQGTYDCGDTCTLYNDCEDSAQPPYTGLGSFCSEEGCPSTNNECCLSLNTLCGNGYSGECCYTNDPQLQLVCDDDLGYCCEPGVGNCDAPIPTSTQTPTPAPIPTAPPIGGPYYCEVDPGGDSACWCNCPVGYSVAEPLCEDSDYPVCSNTCGCEISVKHSCVNETCIADPTGIYDNVYNSWAHCIMAGCDPQYTLTPIPIATPPMKCTPDGQPEGTGIDTAIGCIPFADNNAFVKFVLGWSIGIGGGIAFVLSAVSGFIVATSTGNPKKLAAGKELLMAALSGLILLIFSVFILRLFGYEILKIPGF